MMCQQLTCEARQLHAEISLMKGLGKLEFVFDLSLHEIEELLSIGSYKTDIA